MTDINYIGNTALGKVNMWEDKKAASITPISFPGKNAGQAEGVDTLGIIAYLNFSGRFTGNFETIQNAIYNLKSIADGMQTSSQPLRSPFVNSVDYLEARKQGGIGKNTTATASKLIDSNANFTTQGITTDDKVKNFVTGEVANITSVDSETQLSLDTDIFPVASGTGIGYAVTASINIKILSITTRWEPPALSYCDYSLSVMQVK